MSQIYKEAPSPSKAEMGSLNDLDTSTKTSIVGAVNEINGKLVNATSAAAGLMSASDKSKLDGIATGATANVVSDSLSDTSTTNALSAAKGKELNDGLTSANTAIAALNSNLTNVDHKNVFTYVVAFNKTQTSQGNWTDGGITFPVSPGDRVTMDVMATGTGQMTRSAIGSSGYVYYNDGPAISDFEHGGRFIAFTVLPGDSSITISSYANSSITVRTATITVTSKYQIPQGGSSI